jgi:hypothetical protein
MRRGSVLSSMEAVLRSQKSHAASARAKNHLGLKPANSLNSSARSFESFYLHPVVISPL